MIRSSAARRRSDCSSVRCRSIVGSGRGGEGGSDSISVPKVRLTPRDNLMSRGLGDLQRQIKRVLDAAFELHNPPLRFADLRATVAIGYGGRLPPPRERSLPAEMAKRGKYG